MSRTTALFMWSRAARYSVALLALSSLVATGVWAQPSVMPTASVNVVHLSASGLMQVPQDWLSISLSSTKEGPDAVLLQQQLKRALDAALGVARAAAQPQQLNVHSGRFSLYPRYGGRGRIAGWQGTVELVLEGRDFLRISQTAGQIETLTVSQVVFSLSPRAQHKIEAQVQALAIERFQRRATEVARAFGFERFTLQEVSISSAGQDVPAVQPRLLAMQAQAAVAEEAALPVQAGQSLVTVTVSGSIQLR
ncbi:SIMPL domain-containing protein [Hydrogenophaga sp.]|uniref:SIMPL domain-containing protein n=1 Tax=Hydrogenophaga sp. TaxID=1904254 RepID=UPI0025BFAADF|nr:SIMPL domain-containing protein [Hydrogenophaga sp.]